MTVIWSEEDQAYLAWSPEFEGLIVHGDSAMLAIERLEELLDSVLDEVDKETLV